MNVTSRKGRVSRNLLYFYIIKDRTVTSRKGRVSRNLLPQDITTLRYVTSRKGRVSRNFPDSQEFIQPFCHVPQGACE